MQTQQIKYIFIIGNHKSGSTLLRSLLDAHHQLFAIPIETHPFRFLNYPIFYPLLKNKPKELKVDITVIKQNLYDWVKLNNRQDNSNLGGNYGYNLFDEKEFSYYLNKHLNKGTCEDKKIVDIYFKGIVKSIAKTFDYDYIVEKSVDNFEYAITLSNWFQDSKFIHIIRNPYSNLVSLRKYFYKLFGKKIDYKKIINGLEYSYFFSIKNQKIINNYKVIKYEDLTTSPEETLKKIADFIGIKFDSILLKPTILGQDWKGNSTNKSELKSIESNEFWRTQIKDFEIYLINKYLSYYIDYYDYSKIIPKISKVFSPAKFETFKMYLRNRLLLYV